MPRRLSTSSSTVGGVGVLARAAPGRGEETSVDVDAERHVGAGELGAGDARSRRRSASSGTSVEVVDLLPGEDPLAVGLRRSAACAARHRSRRSTASASRISLAAVGQVDHDPVGAVEAAAARGRPARPRGSSRRPMSEDWSAASCLTRSLTRPRSTTTWCAASPSWSSKLTPSSRRRREVGHQLGGGDQGLAGHAVGEHRRAAEPVGVDDGDLRRRAAPRRAPPRSRRVRRR